MDYNQVVKVVETKQTCEGKNLSRRIQRFNANEQIVQEFLYHYDYMDGTEFLREKTEFRYNDTGKITRKYHFTWHYPSDTGHHWARDLEKIITYEYDTDGRVSKAREEGDNEHTEGRSEYITDFEYFDDGTSIGKQYPAQFYNDPHYRNYVAKHYDKAGRLIMEDRGDLKKFWDYDDAGNVIGESWRYEEPFADRLVGITFPMFRKKYDERGNEIASYHFKGQTGEVSWEVHSVFNEQNQMIQSSMINHVEPERNYTGVYEYEVIVHSISSDGMKGDDLTAVAVLPQSAQILLKKAESGDIATVIDVVANFRDGLNEFPEDIELAFQWCKRGLEIDTHNAELWVQLARCHERAGTDVDKGAADKAYRCAAALGHTPSMYIVAENLYFDGDENSQTECLSWLEKAVANQDKDAEALLGYIYLKGELQTNNRQKGMELLKQSIARGDAPSARLLAEAYLHQIDGAEEVVPYDTGNAAKYFAIAVENGEDSHKALYYAGPAYFYGEGVPKSMEKARKCIETLIDDAYVPEEKVFDLLGCMCFEGVGGPIDCTLGEKALRRAINSDDNSISLEAMSNLGMYLYALENRLSEAIQLLRNAADRGNSNAQVNLGKAYYEGRGVPQNDETAAYYFNLAAKQGNQTAIDNLTVMGTQRSSFANDEFTGKERKRHPIRGAIIGYFVGGFIGVILHLFWPGAEWISTIIGAIIGALIG